MRYNVNKPKTVKKNAKSSKAAKSSKSATPEAKKAKPKVVELETKAAKKQIDLEAVGKSLAERVSVDFDTEVKAGMSKNGRCYVINLDYSSFQIALLVFKDGRTYIKAVMSSSSTTIWNNCVRTFENDELAQKFCRLAFKRGLIEKALEVPYVKGKNEAIAE